MKKILKKIVFVIGMIIFTTLSSNAQGIFFIAADTSYMARGVITNKNLLHTRDSIGGQLDYWENLYSMPSFKRLNSTYNDGTINGGIVWVDANGKLKRSPTIPASYITGLSSPTYNYNVSRTINSSSFTPSSTLTTTVRYYVNIQCTATIGSAGSGKVELQYYNGSTWVTVGEAYNSNTVTLAIVLNSVNSNTFEISGESAPNTQLRLVPTTAGTTTITYVRGTEILK